MTTTALSRPRYGPTLLVLVAAATGTLILLATASALPPPPLGAPGRLRAWATELGAARAAMSGLRLGAVVALGWMVLVGALGVTARLAGWARLAAATDRLAPVTMRRAAASVAGLSVLVGAFGSPSSATDGPADGIETTDSPSGSEDGPSEGPTLGVATMRIVDDSPADPEPIEPATGPGREAEVGNETESSSADDGVEHHDSPGEATLRPIHDGPILPRQSTDATPESRGGPATGPDDGSTAANRTDADAAPHTGNSGADDLPSADRSRHVSPTDRPLRAPSAERPGRPPGPPEHSDVRRPSDPPSGERVRGNAWLVEQGDHLWRIAERTLADAWQRTPSEPEVAGYWTELIRVNRHRLVDPDNPDLLYPGTTLDLPEVATPG